MIRIINPFELKEKLDKNEVVLIDVREQAEYNAINIKEALLIPLGEISIEKIPLSTKGIVLHCKLGKRSIDAALKLLAQDPSLELYSLAGGIIAWQAAGFSVNSAK